MKTKTLPILYYRKLKKNPKVFILNLQVYATLDLTNTPAFIGITQYCADVPVYFGFIETFKITAEIPYGCELEVSENCFEDDHKYTKEEVEQITHPILYMETMINN